MILHDDFWTKLFRHDTDKIMKSLKSEWQFMHEACKQNPAAYKFFEGEKTAEIKNQLYETLEEYEKSNGISLH